MQYRFADVHTFPQMVENTVPEWRLAHDPKLNRSTSRRVMARLDQAKEDLRFELPMLEPAYYECVNAKNPRWNGAWANNLLVAALDTSGAEPLMVGYVSVEAMPWGDDRGYIDTITGIGVRPRYRHQGIAKGLLQTLAGEVILRHARRDSLHTPALRATSLTPDGLAYLPKALISIGKRFDLDIQFNWQDQDRPEIKHAQGCQAPVKTGLFKKNFSFLF